MGDNTRGTLQPGPDQTTAVILAGGKGLRLRSAVPDRQKVLAPVCGRPFLTYLLDKLEDFGTRHVVLCAGYLARDLAESFQGDYGSMNIQVTCEPSALGTAGALRHALSHLQSDHLLVMNGDSYSTVSLDDFAQAHFSRSSDASIVLAHMQDAADYGTVITDANGRITAFDEKTGIPEPAWVNAGVYFIHKRLIAAIPPDKPTSIEKDLFPSWIGSPFFGFHAQGSLIDIGTPERYAAANAYFASQIRPQHGETSYGH